MDVDISTKLVNSDVKNAEFITIIKKIIQDATEHELETENNNPVIEILPTIQERLKGVYDDNFSLSETCQDELINIIMKENLEIAFELAEICQEILNMYNQKEGLNFYDIEVVVKYVLSCVILFLKHWDCSSYVYKQTFNEELTKILEVVKHLYFVLLQMLESSVSFHKNSQAISTLMEILMLICKISQYFIDIDIKSAVTSWKALGTLSVKYSNLLEKALFDVRVLIEGLRQTIYKLLSTFIKNNDETQKETVKSRVRVVGFFTKILLKLTDAFYEDLDRFVMEIIIFYIQVCSVPQEIVSKFCLDTEILLNLDALMHHLLAGNTIFKVYVENLSKYKEEIAFFQENPVGMLNFCNRVLRVLRDVHLDCSGLVLNVIETVFNVLTENYSDLSSSCDGNVLNESVVNISAALLLHGETSASIEILLKYLLGDDPVAAITSVNIFAVIARNLSEEECLALLVFLLKSVNALKRGVFTHRPELLFFKCLIQNLLRCISDNSKVRLAKSFDSVEFLSVWKMLGFNVVQQNAVVIDSVMENTTRCVNNINAECNQDIPTNIGEGLGLLSTINLQGGNAKIASITRFVATFWDLDFSSEKMLENNIFRYIMAKILKITTRFLKNSTLNSQIVFSKLKSFCLKKNYWAIVFVFVSDLLFSFDPSRRRDLLTEISGLISITVQSQNSIIKAFYIELFQCLNKHQKETLNVLLDTVKPNIAHQIFQSLTVTDSTKKCHAYYQHKCLRWKKNIDTVQPKFKKARLDLCDTKENSPDEEESSLDEVISRLKGEIKCLIKVSKTDQLTAKNAADLRIILSQISSIMR